MTSSPATAAAPSSDAPAKAKKKTINLPTLVNGLAVPLLLLVVLLSVLSYLGRVHLFCELLSHFRFQFFLLSWVPFVLLSLTGERPWLWTALFCLGLNGVAIAPWYLPLPVLGESGPPLRVMVSNVLSENRSYDAFYALVEQEQPDLLVTLEVNDEWVRELTDLELILPYSAIEPREDNFGIALYSKQPLDDVERVIWGEGAETAELAETAAMVNTGVPSITAQIDWQGQLIELVATHAMPPINPGYFEARNDHLRSLAQYLRELGGGRPKLVLGDFNTTMWSPFYQSLVRKAKLKNAREGFGIQPTWPSKMPLLQIPIDHILTSHDFTVLDSRRRRLAGSDHDVLLADVAL